jgi:hypothetical protein
MPSQLPPTQAPRRRPRYLYKVVSRDTHVEEGQGGPVSIGVDGIHLVHLDLLSTLDRSVSS